MKLGLRARLSLLLAAFGVLATGLTGLYAYRQQREVLVQTAERELQTTTHVFGRRLASVFGRISGEARQLAQQRVTREAAAGGPTAAQRAAVADAFESSLRNQPRYFQLRLISAADNGLELVRVDRDGTGPLRVQGDALQEKAHYPYVFQALQLGGGEVFLSKIGLDHEADSHAAQEKPTLHVATPVLGDAGQRLGVIVIGVDVARIFADLRADMPGYLRLLLANEWGDYLIHPDPAQAFAFEQGQRVLMQETFPTVEALLKAPGTPLLAQASLNEGAQVTPVLGAFQRLRLAPDARGGDVVLGIAEPLDEILRSSRALGRTMAQIVIAISAVAIGLAMLAAGLVTRPIKQITRETRRFSMQHMAGELPVERSDEIGELARGFHEMQQSVLASMAELHASRERLAEQARTDPLTGLYNRGSFAERLEHGIAAARRNDRGLGLLFVDLDRFKQVNDRHGHAVGDNVLQHVAQRLKSAVRDVDTVGRLGGDEFVVLLEGVDDERDASRVAQALIELFRQPVAVGEARIELGLSIGISVFPRDGQDVNSLMQRADEAMYRCKSEAGNRYSVSGSQ
ncbi:MAG TPA: diguanylate cyclase [Burkholderiaceae bacterium]|jgi:diguanylate cyclase (GGDEF)-like protein|nr:diguanylate cyclase [Burkholderiaceae bacterium]